MLTLTPSKPRNARAARAVAAREPQHTENPKRPLFLRSTSSSALLNTLTQNLYALKRPDAVRFAKKNAVHPFEDASSLEFFARKNDTSLLVFASHSKKRPHCITIARTFDARLLDMLECCVDPATARALDQFGGRKWRVGAKPMMCFSGPQFETTGDAAAGTGGSKFALAKSLFLDLFRGAETSEMDVEGLDALLSFAAVERGEGAARSGWVLMRAWRVVTKRAGGGSKMPRVELEEVGPRIDFRLGRMQEADPNMWKEAMKREKVAKVSPSVQQLSLAASLVCEMAGTNAAPLAQGEEERGRGPHRRQDRAAARGQARLAGTTDAKDEGPQTHIRGGRHGRGAARRGRQRGRRRRPLKEEEVRARSGMSCETNETSRRPWTAISGYLTDAAGRSISRGRRTQDFRPQPLWTHLVETILASVQFSEMLIHYLSMYHTHGLAGQRSGPDCLLFPLR